MAILKKKSKPAPEPTHDFNVGETVTFLEEGALLTGEIIEIDEAEETVIITEENSRDDYGVAFADVNPPAKPKGKSKPPVKGKQSKPEPEPDEEEEKPKKGRGKAKGKGKSYSSLFNEAEPVEGGGGFPVGDWEGILIEATASERDGNMQAVLKFVGVNDAEVEGKTMSKFYQLIDGNMEALQGLGYFKADLGRLGYEDLEIEGDTMEEAIDSLNDLLEEVAQEEFWVSLKAKEKGGYTNLFLQGLMDEQTDKPDVPKY